MAVENYETPPDVTDAEIVAHFRYMLTRGAVAGVEYEIRGRRMVFPGVEAALKIIKEFEARIAADNGGGMVTNYARLNRR